MLPTFTVEKNEIFLKLYGNIKKKHVICTFMCEAHANVTLI